LSNSIRKRISHFHGRCYSCKAYRRDSCSHSNIGILFSGGIDSTVIALIADDHVSKDKEIDLLNVSFTGESAPDRVTARSALEELTHLRPHRKWRLILIDPTKQELADWRSNRIKHLIYPLETVLDDSIGCSIWFAASGNIQIQEKETSSARILLHGLGSDEQLAGYSRHRRIFDKKGLIGLEEELKRELDNLHTRNLGRDDRLVSDHGKEVRYPFLEEDVISFLNSIPISIKCDLTLPRGEGEKKLLRQLAQRLGLHRVSQFEKRAIQFGTRISKIVNEGREKGDMKCSRLLD
jgi:asparagine synthetase B (glutamine-hydrolysing)